MFDRSLYASQDLPEVQDDYRIAKRAKTWHNLIAKREECYRREEKKDCGLFCSAFFSAG